MEVRVLSPAQQFRFAKIFGGEVRQLLDVREEEKIGAMHKFFGASSKRRVPRDGVERFFRQKKYS